MTFGQGKSGNEYVKNANIRKALSLAIDRGGLRGPGFYHRRRGQPASQHLDLQGLDQGQR